MQEATVCLLQRGDGKNAEILLGRRTDTLFASGRWNGPGGKFRKKETVLRCTKREVQEEIGVEITTSTMRHFATADYYHPQGTEHSLKRRVHFVSATCWTGEPRPLDGFDMLQWFPRHNMPYHQMMADQIVWLPQALQDTSERLLIVEIFYADATSQTVERGSFKFVTRPTRS